MNCDATAPASLIDPPTFTEVKTSIFTEDDLCDLNRAHIPRHVAIMMDGNRRWAKRNDKKNEASGTHLSMKGVLHGYWSGASVLKDIVKAAQEIGIQVLTVWGFSTENWKRPRLEIDALLQIFEFYIKDNLSTMIEQGVRFNVIGEISPFPFSLKKEINRAIAQTKQGKSIDLVIAINYGGRDEIVRATRSLVEAYERKEIAKEMIDESCLSRFMDTASWPDPELVIRTSNEMRLSNFLLWQVAYSEIYITETLWPDFTPHHLLEAILHYQKRERRFGR